MTSPCKNIGLCIPQYSTNTYRCEQYCENVDPGTLAIIDLFDEKSDGVWNQKKVAQGKLRKTIVQLTREVLDPDSDRDVPLDLSDPDPI